MYFNVSLNTVLVTLALLWECSATRTEPGIATFLSAPADQETVLLHVLTNKKPKLQSPGLIFLTPFRYAIRFYAPTLYRQNGDLVWAGQYTAKANANNFHTTQFKGQPGNHFLYSDGEGTTHDSGFVRVFNGSYDQVSPNYGARNGLSLPDDHEVIVPSASDGTTLIYDIYQLHRRNLTAYDGPEHGYIVDGCFQEISLTNHSLIFQWCASNHIPFYETYVFLPNSGNYSNSNSGYGTKDSPWDYFHINAIDKDVDGNYLVSSRHCSALFKVAGKQHPQPGSILWRLGGKYNSFTMNPTSFNFSFQHDGRWLSAPTRKSTILSLFDNGSDGNGLQSSPASSGMVVSVNEKSKVATLKHQYIQPEYRSAGSQGSLQVMPNGNAFICWGQVPYISEFTRSGELLYNAKFGSLAAYLPEYNSYRGFKAPWIGTPSVAPNVFAYSRHCNSTTKYAYASWNGATEVAYWRLQTSNSENSQWSLQDGIFAKKGYETTIQYNSTELQEFVQALAYDDSDKLLATTSSVRVFVPLSKYHSQCNAMRCDGGFTYSSSNNKVQSCGASTAV